VLPTLQCRYFQRGFFWSVPIGALAGLVGLGGGEFRLPVLTQAIGFPPQSAIPLNLLISLVTLASALIFRNHAIPVASAADHLPEIVGLTIGGIVSAIYGAGLVQRMSTARLTTVMAALLGAIGVLLLVEAFVPFGGSLLEAAPVLMRAVAGLVIGLGVGVVSSMLGVAGGELLIPALLFIFGADIKVAGTASLAISLVIVSTGLWHYYRAGKLPLGRGPQRIVTGMSVGSLIGAAAGAAAVALAPTAIVKIFLGCVLLAAAAKTASHRG
jgi:uncharacterized membrane protein YfcA